MAESIKIMEGAEPFSAKGDSRGALVLHGFTGCPQSMRPLAEAFARAGFSVELPRLPGHGTTPEDMAQYRWSDWAKAVDEAYQDLARRTLKVVVAGLSMGGSLTLWLAEKRPEVAGVVLVNPVVEDQDFSAFLEGATALLAGGQEFMPGIAGDIADPNSKELGYDRVPNATVRPLIEGIANVKANLSAIRCPALILHSIQDHVVPPGSTNALKQHLGGVKEYVELQRGFHVATIDFDRDEINERAVSFGKRVTA
jgi:carboxylesterase